MSATETIETDVDEVDEVELEESTDAELTEAPEKDESTAKGGSRPIAGPWAFKAVNKPQTQIHVPPAGSDPRDIHRGTHVAVRFRQDFYPDDYEQVPLRRQYFGPGYFYTEDPYVAEYLAAAADRDKTGNIQVEPDVEHAKAVWEKVESLFRTV